MHADTLGAGRGIEPAVVLRRVLKFTLAPEGIGFVLLTVRNLFSKMSFLDAVWHGLFHSVSAFCNAGFALHENSLEDYVGDPLVNLTVCALVVIGGLGFPVLLDLTAIRRDGWRAFWKKAQLHTRLMLVATPVLIVAGTVAILLFEWNGDAFEKLPWYAKLQAGLFQSVTCRTAGFNTVEIPDLTNATLFLMMILMVIGGGACSTAGGVKVSTASLLLLRALAAMRGRPHVQIYRRTVPDSVITRAATTVFVFAVLLVAALTMLLALEQSTLSHSESKGLFLEALFEIVSALGTVGLTVGMTNELTTGGQLLVILLMFAGRLGPISIFAAISRVPRKGAIDYPYETPLVG